jgi:hypothetical protein
MALLFQEHGDFLQEHLAKEIISAKIHNSSVILKRNSIDSQELKKNGQ